MQMRLLRGASAGRVVDLPDAEALSLLDARAVERVETSPLGESDALPAAAPIPVPGPQQDPPRRPRRSRKAR